MRGYYETEKARATQPNEEVTPLKELAREWRNLADLPPTDDETSRVLRLCADDLDASMRAAGIGEHKVVAGLRDAVKSKKQKGRREDAENPRRATKAPTDIDTKKVLKGLRRY